ncbi:MAG TPA: 4Fe-4S dicluster domain-containing protein [Chloroflexia bacterium]|nr:4Fe-4S dicluster domain-containing protein [Chloroflexia bacterium]
MSAISQEQKDDCRPETGRNRPVIDRNRCEGKESCVEVCPYNVFEIRKLEGAERQQLSLVGKIKLMAHGGKQAFAVRAEDCHSCGLCVKACPEKAIKLAKY